MRVNLNLVGGVVNRVGLRYDVRMSWMQRFFSPKKQAILQLFTPQSAGRERPAKRLMLAGATALGIVGAGLLASGSLVMLLVALGALYFLVTRVLGIELELDPRAFVEQAQRYAQTAARN